eukprot:GHVS01056813.1.p1 GENE.GHVS01056813.1~~GHVS01056813.1.p1  ORF type:complete len:739 (+),score=90.93 GHVS01056813.1:235-2451(+)
MFIEMLVDASTTMGGGSSSFPLIPVALALVSGAVCLLWILTRGRMNGTNQEAKMKPAAAKAAVVAVGGGSVRRASYLQQQENSSNNNEPVFVYFGSQTGTAESFAKELSEEMESHGVKQVEVTDLEDFDEEDFLAQRWVVFVVATYGEGEPTDNAADANRWLCSKQREEGCLQSTKFAVFGLGNRQYSQYNEMGKRVERHMIRLGATQFSIRGEGDDDQDIEADFAKWKKLFWPAFASAREGRVEGSNAVAAAVDGDPSGPSPSDSAISRSWKDNKHASLSMLSNVCNIWEKSKEDDLTGSGIHSKMYFHSKTATVKTARELRQQPDRSAGLTTYHLDLHFSPGEGLSYQTADNIDVLPHNPIDCVNWFIGRIVMKADSLTPDHYIHWESPAANNTKRPFKTPCTVREALTLYSDLTALPHKNSLKDLACFVRDTRERTALENLLSESSETRFKLLVKDTQISLREFVELFMTSAVFELAGFLQLVPRQRFRPYTISSSSKADPGIVSLTVSQVYKKLPSLAPVIDELQSLGFITETSRKADLVALRERPRAFIGVCSTFLCNIQQPASPTSGMSLQVLMKPSSFKLPRDPLVPVIMIATGTGIAPFRGFMREFAKAGTEFRRETVLFFGCTHSERDWIYRDEMEAAKAAEPPILKHLICAFSRQQEHKIYVQDKLREHECLVWDLMQRGGFLYVCGGMSMGHAIETALSDIGRSNNAGDSYVEDLRAEKRFVEELWS